MRKRRSAWGVAFGMSRALQLELRKLGVQADLVVPGRASALGWRLERLGAIRGGMSRYQGMRDRRSWGRW